jgi:hypothetical protein
MDSWGTRFNCFLPVIGTVLQESIKKVRANKMIAELLKNFTESLSRLSRKMDERYGIKDGGKFQVVISDKTV